MILVFLFILSIAADVSGQLCFKVSANRDAALQLHDSGIRYWKRQAASMWLWAGIIVYIVEFIVWLQILARAPLSLAFPIASLNYCGVALASRFILGEYIHARRWLGILCITIGVAVVAVS